MQSKERKRKELRKIEESAGQGKISFAKLPCRVYKCLIIFNFDSSCWENKQSIAYQQKILCKVLSVLANSTDPCKFENA